MASNYTALGVQLMTTGEKAGTWGTLTNTNWDIIEQISGGYTVQDVAGGAATTDLSVSDGSVGAVLSHRIIDFTGAITGNQIVTIPIDVQTFYILKNSTTDGTDAFTVQFKYITGSGSSVTFSGGDRTTKIVYATADDGTNPNIVDCGFGVGDVTLTGTQTLTNKTLTAPKFADGGFIADTTGAETLVFGEVGTPLNEFKITNAASGNGPILASQGQTNVPINITPAGTGDVFINPPSTGALIISGTSTQAGKIVMQADTDDTGSFVASFQPGVLTESTAYTLPLAYATIAGQSLKSTTGGVLSWGTAGLAWQAVETGTSVTAVVGNGYFIDTTSNVCDVTLPAGVLGDEVTLVDYAGTFDTNNLTVTPASGEKIQGQSADTTMTSAVERSAFTLAYSGASQGWLLKDK